MSRQGKGDVRDIVQIMSNIFQPEQLSELSKCLKKEGYRYSTFEGFENIQAAFSDPNTGLLLVKATGENLPRLIEAIKAKPRQFDIPVLVYLEQFTLHHDLELLFTEIDDFLLEPLDLRDICLRIRRLTQRFTASHDEQVKLNVLSHFGMMQFIGSSPAFMVAIGKIPRVAASDVTVLITGESGTGKEMCARAIHYLSSRANKPFIPVNCGSIPANLFENELFGHEPGAYTDARQARPGLIAEAEGGTLFLDEVDSLPLADQVKLLRFLQDKQYKPLGGSQYRRSNTRVLAATNQQLHVKVQQRLFREDLYYRLNVISLHLPSLRERREDIPLLAQHFLKVAKSDYHRSTVRFSSGALACMSAYEWPGNVRELENAVRQAVVLNDKPVIQAEDLKMFSHSYASSTSAPVESFKKAKARTVETFERHYLQEVLSSCGGNISQAAREAQKNRRAFFALLKKYNLTTSQELQEKE
jgi:DNA-binding NtrC family response regulator